MKRGAIAINFIVMAIIALLVLVLIVLFVTGYIPKITEWISGTGPDDEEIARVNCEKSCNFAKQANDCSGYKASFCEKYYDEVNGTMCYEIINCPVPARLEDCSCS